jgi:heme-degrading monooxygenase HmoA
MHDAAFAPLPAPPYFAVIFSSRRSDDPAGYAAMADLMTRTALDQPGCLGAETARGADGFGITVSYWQTEADILAWKNHAQHLVAQREGQARWYTHYTLRIARVERQYTGPDGRAF